MLVLGGVRVRVLYEEGGSGEGKVDDSQNSTGGGGPLIKYFRAKKRTVSRPSAANERRGRRTRPNHLFGVS